MKVLIIAHSIYPFSIGGIETHVYYLTKYLRNKGVTVKVITKNGVISAINKKTLLKPPLFTEICNLLKENYDFLHIHGVPKLLSCAILLLLSKLRRRTVIWTPHGFIDNIFQKSVKGSIKHKLALLLMRVCANKMFDRFIAVHPGQQEVFNRIGIKKNKIFFIPNGIPDHYFKNGDHMAFKNKYNLKDKKIITFIGRLTPHKRVNDLIEVINEIVKNYYKNVFLIIAGPDVNELKRLRELVKCKNILFLGQISEAQKLMLLDSTDIFVNPSSFEAFGLSLVESMAKGIPVISANNVGAMYVLDNGKYGLLYSIGNKKELLERILYLIENPEDAKCIGKKGKERALEFTWEKILDLFLNTAYKV